MEELTQKINLLIDRVNKLEENYRQHRHTGQDSQKVKIYDIIKETGTLTLVDNSSLTSADATVIANTRTRLVELEDILKANKILK